MLLVVDVGNSNTVLGAFDGEALVEHWRLETHRNRTTDEYRVVVSELFRLSGMSTTDVDAAILASVVPPLTPVLHEALSRTFDVEALHVGPGIRTGMPVRARSSRWWIVRSPPRSICIRWSWVSISRFTARRSIWVAITIC